MRLRLNGSAGKTPKARGKKRGVGDLISSVTSALGVKPCGGCKKRADKLNRATGKIRF